MNPTEVADELEALVSRPFDPEEFPFAFAAATGNASATVSKLRSGKRSLNRSRSPGAVLLNKKFHCAGTRSEDLDAVLEELRSDKSTEKHKPAILLVSNGEQVVAEQFLTGETMRCAFRDLHRHFGFFLPAAGMNRYEAAEENEIDIKATGKLAKLYDALVKKNPDWASPARRHDLNQFMTRIVFCLFAEDVGIFEKDQFTRLIVNHAGDKGVEADVAIIQAFTAMNRPVDEREDLPAWTREIEYVNGGLFADRVDCPKFDAISWGYFKDAARLFWCEINPDIFGSLIQSIADPKARSELGMHYTSVPNILKVLGPLFLDEIDEAIEKSWGRPGALGRILDRLGQIHVFDPACGSGNFLVVAYRQLREREMKILARMGQIKGQTQVQMWSSISLANFYGVELTDFGAETAKLALFIAEYQSNAAMAAMFGASAEALPLRDGGRITCGNALRLDWEDVCPPLRTGAEVFIAGNPPFLGSTYQSKDQKSDLAFVFSGTVKSFAAFDFVSAWFYKAAAFVRTGRCRAALVATNSVCQGYSVAALWPNVLHEDLEIFFAHKDFRWRNNAAKNAAVVCSIIGIRQISQGAKRLFANGTEIPARNINAYLANGPNVFVEGARSSLFGLPAMDYGNKPVEGGHLLLTEEEKVEFLRREPRAGSFIRPFMGSKEVVNGFQRYCIWIDEDRVDEAMGIPAIRERIDRVAEFRSNSTDKYVREKLQPLSYRFKQVFQAEKSSILVPRVTSERRPYLPVDRLGADVISSDLNFALYDAPEWCIAVIASRLHLVWIGAVCGRLESRFRYSNTLGWNTFPAPRFSQDQLDKLNASARTILKTRYLHHPKTIADLYNPDKMPDDLREVHRQNDEMLETMYIGRPFRNDTERLERLFKLYATRAEKLKTEAA